MLTRRDFIQTGTAAGVAAAMAPQLAAAALPVDVPHPVLTIADGVIDQRLAASQAFVDALAPTGTRGLAFTGDISPLWRSTMSSDWRAAPRATAGLTTHGPLFILERMGWTHDLRVTFRAQHRRAANGTLEHEIQGPVDLVDALAAALPQAGADFSAVVAKALAKHPQGNGPQAHRIITTDTAVAMDEELYSWVLAPRCDCGGLAPYSHTHSA